MTFENQIVLGDALATMATLPAASVDCVLTDLPYGTTDNKWDSVIPMDQFWAAWRRVCRPGAPIVLFTQQPFTTIVAASNLRQLKTEWIWEKGQGTGFLNAKKYPLKNHENVLVFCDRKPPYYPQKESGKPPCTRSKKANTTTNYSGTGASTYINTDGTRYPITVLRAERWTRDRGLHPTQKPLALCEYLIRTYTQPGELVLDCTAGSGTTLLAARNTGRRFFGVELDPVYHATATARLAESGSIVPSIAASGEDEEFLVLQRHAPDLTDFRATGDN